MEHYDIGIIGGGPSAVCLLSSIVDSEHRGGSLAIFNAGTAWWRGRPFQKDHESIRINSHASDMSIGETVPSFEEWLNRSNIVQDFPPRTVYGDYLEYCANECVTILKSRSWSVSKYNCLVTSCREGKTDGYEVVSDNQIRATAKQVILAVGVGPPMKKVEAEDEARYINDPYPAIQKLSNITPSAEVGVIGAGLTAVDVAVSLKNAGHQGPIHLTSRSGILPAVRQQRINVKSTIFSPIQFRDIRNSGRKIYDDDVKGMLDRELQNHGYSISHIVRELQQAGSEDPKDRITRQLNELVSSDHTLRIMQSVVPAAGPEMWTALTDESRSGLKNRYERQFLSLCCPMPPENALVISDMLSSGQLSVSSAVHAATVHNQRFRISQAHGKHLEVDYLVNASSPDPSKIPSISAPLVNQMVRDQIVQKDANGGLLVDPRSSQCVKPHKSTARSPVYAIGDITSGTFYFTFGIISIVDRSRDITALALDSVAEPKTCSANPVE